MEFTINRDIFLKSLGHANGIIEKKTTLPILSNILIEAKESKIKITATDLDIIYSEVMIPQVITKEGSSRSFSNELYNHHALPLPSVFITLDTSCSITCFANIDPL